MDSFLKTTFTRHKFQGLAVSTALGNLAGYVAGSLVTIASTRTELERGGIRNLFGVLPRKKIVVHLMPHWLEWLLAILIGFLVMEAVRYCFNYCTHAAFMKESPSDPQPENRAPIDTRKDPAEPYGSAGEIHS
jgi:hypothetical protein